MCVCPSFLSKAFYVTSSVPWTFPVLYFLFIYLYVYVWVYPCHGRSESSLGAGSLSSCSRAIVLRFDSMQAVEPTLWPCFYSIVFSLD